jgi:hypothetical protein
MWRSKNSINNKKKLPENGQLFSYLFTPGLSSYPAVKIAARNATITPKIRSNPMYVASSAKDYVYI